MTRFLRPTRNLSVSQPLHPEVGVSREAHHHRCINCLYPSSHGSIHQLFLSIHSLVLSCIYCSIHPSIFPYNRPAIGHPTFPSPLDPSTHSSSVQHSSYNLPFTTIHPSANSSIHPSIHSRLGRYDGIPGYLEIQTV